MGHQGLNLHDGLALHPGVEGHGAGTPEAFKPTRLKQIYEDQKFLPSVALGQIDQFL